MKNKSKKSPFEIVCICFFVFLVLAIFFFVFSIPIGSWYSFNNRTFHEEATYEDVVSTLSEYEDLVILPPDIFETVYPSEYKISKRKSGTEPSGYIVDLYYGDENVIGLFQVKAEPKKFPPFDTPANRLEKTIKNLKKDRETKVYRDGYKYIIYLKSGSFDSAEEPITKALEYILK